MVAFLKKQSEEKRLAAENAFKSDNVASVQAQALLD
jgi:hypothetical protein